MGFYGAAEPSGGSPLQSELRPIDLIIQDRASPHLGPARHHRGSLRDGLRPAGITRLINGERRGPKIVASTATVRRAETQIRNLFGREQTAIFPPPGIDRTNSFFAEVDHETPSRLYVGVASPGRGPKLVFLRALQTLLAGSAALSSGGQERSRRSLPDDALLLQRAARTRRRAPDRRRRSARASDELRTKPRASRAHGRSLRRSHAARKSRS